MPDKRVVLRLRVWLPLVAVFIVLLSVALVFAYGVPVFRERLTSYAQDRTFATAAAAAEALSKVNRGSFQKTLSAFSTQITSGKLLVVNTHGRVVVQEGHVDGFDPSDKMLQTAAAGRRMSERLDQLNVAVAPLVEEGTVKGGVLFASDEPERTAYQLFLRSGLEAAGIALILGGGLMLLLGTLLSRRVERLTLGARAIEGGNLSYRIEPGYKDELGELAGYFNAMATRLQRSFAQLESRVAERTAELEAERARLETVLRQMPSGVVIAEAPSGKILLSNERAREIRGRDLPPAVGSYEHNKNLALHLDGTPYEPEDWPLARSIRTGEEVVGEEILLPRNDGELVTVSVNSGPIRDEDGRIVAGVVVFNDITEQKRVEEARREIEERYRVVVETASDAIVMIDEDSRLLFVNGAAERIFGHTRAEMLGQQLTMLMPEHLRDVHQASLERYVHSGIRHLNWASTELPGLHKSGKEIPLEVSFGQFTKGGQRFFTGFMRDITKRKRAEEEVRRLNEELEQRVEERTAQLEQERATLDAILTNLTEGVLAADSRQCVVFANPAARSMLGFGSEELLERLPDPWEDFHLSEAATRCAEAEGECIEARVLSGDALLHVKLEHLPKFGDHRGGTLVMMRDLSEGRRLEMHQQRFLANAAHELKTPITTILGASDLLLADDEDPEVRRRFLNHIFTEAHRMQRLSETLLRLARVGWDLREPELKVVDLGAAAREVTYRMAPLAESTGIELSLEGHGTQVRADEEWLEQALLVVVSNAVKYSGRGSHIRLRLEGSTVAVEDEGAGISAEDLPHVFDRFYQGEYSSGGFGLGLPICKELVERMSGKISIDSQEGVGTTVEINLPEVQDG